MKRRFLRQARLVGAAGQEKISSAHAIASCEIEARYLAAAGVHVELIARDDHDARFDGLDPAARDVALGAHAAVVALKKILEC
jgi:hypothetical protein